MLNKQVKEKEDHLKAHLKVINALIVIDLVTGLMNVENQKKILEIEIGIDIEIEENQEDLVDQEEEVAEVQLLLEIEDKKKDL